MRTGVGLGELDVRDPCLKRETWGTRILRLILNWGLAGYKSVGSPVVHSVGLGGGCRFQPTCSEYAALAVAQHGAWRGLWLAGWRVLRCHPLARGGWDPVPAVSDGHSGGEASLLAGPAAGTIEKPHPTNEPA